jgi:hypothetical protein
MRRIICVCITAALAACGGGTDQADTAADTAALMPAAPAGINLADVAGTWNVQVMPEASDSVVLTYQLTTTNSTEGWSMKFPDRPDPVPVQVVAVEGDSVVIHAGPYPSALRSDVTVTVDGVSRMVNGEMLSRFTAHYSAGPDSVVTMRARGTRAQ